MGCAVSSPLQSSSQGTGPLPLKVVESSHDSSRQFVAPPGIIIIPSSPPRTETGSSERIVAFGNRRASQESLLRVAKPVIVSVGPSLARTTSERSPRQEKEHRSALERVLGESVPVRLSRSQSDHGPNRYALAAARRASASPASPSSEPTEHFDAVWQEASLNARTRSLSAIVPPRTARTVSTEEMLAARDAALRSRTPELVQSRPVTPIAVTVAAPAELGAAFGERSPRRARVRSHSFLAPVPAASG